MKPILETTLLLAATGQFCIAILNFSLVRIMHWKEDLDRAPLLIREVFYIHAWFISITLAIFGALTFRFAAAMAGGDEPVYRWIACSVGCFWSIRAVLQITHYSSSHWRGIPTRTAIHILLLAVYTGFAAVYLTAGFIK